MGDDSFHDFILDQLRGLTGVRSRPMFGGHGLYCDEVFFGILHNGRLYLKTDPASRSAYLEQGMAPFQPNARQTLTSYYEAPPEVLESPDRLCEWARRAIRCGPTALPASRRRPARRKKK
ncbi:MAG: TfoX/Sxy family protein [Nitrospirota bacterium]